jgi:hypothetical protein
VSDKLGVEFLVRPKKNLVYQLLSLTKICNKHVVPEGQVVMKEGEMLVQPIAIRVA